MMSSTTLGSASAEMSPRSSAFLAAIFFKILRMILPLRVFGKSLTMIIRPGAANGPISFRTF